MHTERLTERVAHTHDTAVGAGRPGDAPALRAQSTGCALPAGTRLGEFEVRSLIGEGGFGLVYLAFDLSLQREVAIKEYLPVPLNVRRGADGSVEPPRGVEAGAAFDAGLKGFLNEARLLARFDHPSLLKVHRFWQAAGTAYMAMPYYEGPTLKAAVRQRGPRWSEAEIRRWLDPLLDALAVLHAKQCYHRDIAPDNILLTAAGPVLLDFGAARRVIEDMTHGLTAILKPGFAPIEQYGGEGTGSQGPWTDLYALANVVRHAITGNAPLPSVDRVVSDELRPLSHGGYGPYRPGFLRAIDAALAVLPAQRPQSVAEFRALLDGAEPMAAEADTVDAGCDICLPDVASADGTTVAAGPASTVPLPRQPSQTAASLAAERTIKVTPAAPVHAVAGRKPGRRTASGAALVCATVAAAAWLATPWHARPPKPEPRADAVAAQAEAAMVRDPAAVTQTQAAAAPARPAVRSAALAQEAPSATDGAAERAAVAISAQRHARPHARPAPSDIGPFAAVVAAERAGSIQAGPRNSLQTAGRTASTGRIESQAGGGAAHDCGELLQRASLGAASEEDAASIRRHCH